MNLKQRFEAFHPSSGGIALAFLGQAGVLLKNAAGYTIAVDPYLGNGCEAAFGFRRLTPPPIMPGELRADCLVSTHAHMDHFDPEVLHALAGSALCVGTPDCEALYSAAGVPPERRVIRRSGEEFTTGEAVFRAVYADHGELAPDAVGWRIVTGDVCIYVSGDTACRLEPIQASLGEAAIDVMIVPINPAFGNPDSEGAIRLGAMVRPRVLAGVHFGMFAEHGGDPEEFRTLARQRLNPETIAVTPEPGQLFSYSRAAGWEEVK